MKKEIVTKPLVKARRGAVRYCRYCGEDANTGVFCPTCRSKSGREAILEQNKAILEQLREKGYCKNPVLLPAV